MLVKDRMTIDPIAITPDTSFPEAYGILREKGIRHLPVLDDTGNVVGIVAKSDLLHASPATDRTLSIFEVNYLLANMHVHEVMSSPPITVDEDTPLEEAARVMVQKKIGCLPVMRGSTLAGMITETDIFETFVEVLGGEEASLRVTLRVPDVHGELARVSGLIAELGGNICSVARFRGEDPQYCYITLRLEGVDEDVLVPALKNEVEEVVHVCCAS
ncbi:MAG: CBS domain-containing protein [Anaerolineales bacterium]|nr:CBS domain-containing protein [Anaerolineales bacterium]